MLALRFSFGGGMCNICVAYLGLPVLTFCTVRAGDYIDHSAASVTGETPVTVRMHKESDFSLKGQSAISMDQALALYYNDVVRNVVTFANSDGTYDDLLAYMKRRKLL